ncbi:hypothetical protein NONI108955_43360 [Nocardia ninae]|uniref:Uncharacterized protein n=1 Tax=Nocardia ninae NBRC 108245 TaxID=1210091 RepID=A0A511MB88_9NOCA|nr:hypothetical protein [Nocardia ninae]GEM37368.1 hypothetical protein NN4_18870 [Nocardia ninae NBRC 108245]
MTSTEYTTLYFSQANPAGPGQADVSTLLRSVAATIEELGPVTVADLILHNEVTADGNWPSITVYYSNVDSE